MQVDLKVFKNEYSNTKYKWCFLDGKFKEKSFLEAYCDRFSTSILSNSISGIIQHLEKKRDTASWY